MDPEASEQVDDPQQGKADPQREPSDIRAVEEGDDDDPPDVVHDR